MDFPLDPRMKLFEFDKIRPGVRGARGVGNEGQKFGPMTKDREKIAYIP